MSFKAFVWAWDQPLTKDDHLIVLLALADIANESGSLFASCAYIAKHCRRNERTVRRALAAMDGSTVTITERPGRTDLIRLNIPSEFTVAFHREEEHEQGRRGRPRKTLAKVSENPGLGDEKPPSQVSDEPKTGTTEGTLVVSAGEQFDAWWSIYPRKAAKAAAREAFPKAVAKVPFPDLMRTTERFAGEVIDRPRDKIPHPATWLNGERWTDEPEANRSQTDGRAAPPTGLDRGAAQHHARVASMVRGAGQALDRRRARWGVGNPADSHQPDAAGRVPAALAGPRKGEPPES